MTKKEKLQIAQSFERIAQDIRRSIFYNQTAVYAAEHLKQLEKVKGELLPQLSNILSESLLKNKQ